MAKKEDAVERSYAAQFCVARHDDLAAVSGVRTGEHVIERARIGLRDAELLNALESMVKAAKAGQLESKDILAAACVTW